MKNTFSLQQISQTPSLYSNLLFRQCKLDLVARFMEIKSINPKLKQSERAKELAICTSTF